jgi:hypothetical protein
MRAASSADFGIDLHMHMYVYVYFVCIGRVHTRAV